MKKYVGLALITAILIGVFFSLTAIVGSMITEVTIIKPEKQQFSQDIYTGGILEETEKKDIFSELPIVPEKVNVMIGDTVEAGQVLAKVDPHATQSALLNLVESASAIPEEYRSLLNNLKLDTSLIQQAIPLEIIAPTSGTITGITMSPGIMSVPQTALCSISKTDTLRLKLTVSEEEIDQVEVGDLVLFKATATGSQKYIGKVSRIFPSANKTLVGTSQQTVVGIYAEIGDGTERLKPGYTVTGVIKKKAGAQYPVIPYEAILQDSKNQEYVYLYKNGRAVRQNITSGIELSQGVCITSGITESDFIISDASIIPGENALVRTS